MIERQLRPRVLEALDDTRVAVVLGARQVGKSTLVEQIASEDRSARILTLDDGRSAERSLGRRGVICQSTGGIQIPSGASVGLGEDGGWDTGQRSARTRAHRNRVPKHVPNSAILS
jgi:hypothetical protein